MRFSVFVGSRLRKFPLLRKFVKYYAEFFSSLLFCRLFNLPSYSKSRLHQVFHFGMETFFGYWSKYFKDLYWFVISNKIKLSIKIDVGTKANEQIFNRMMRIHTSLINGNQIDVYQTKCLIFFYYLYLA